MKSKMIIAALSIIALIFTSFAFKNRPVKAIKFTPTYADSVPVGGNSIEEPF